MFQGVWFIVMGYALWTPSLIPKGCFLNLEEGHLVVRCHDNEALHRAKSLVNIQFSWLLIAITIFVMFFYLVLVKFYGDKVEYSTLTREEDQLPNDDLDDVESQKSKKVGDKKSFMDFEKALHQLTWKGKEKIYRRDQN
jgi:hypothetical protein